MISAQNEAVSEIGKNALVTAGGKLDVTADTDEDLLLISVSAASTQGTVAAGGTVDVIVNEAVTNAIIGANTVLAAKDDVNVKARDKETLISLIASLSGNEGQGHAGAGSVNVLVTKSDTRTILNDKARISLGNVLKIEASGDLFKRDWNDPWTN